MAFELEEKLPPILARIAKVKDVRVYEEEKRVHIVFEFSPDMVDIYGGVHGAVIGVLSMIGAEWAAFLATKENEYLIATSMNIHFLKQPEEFSDIEVESNVVSRTDRMVLVSTTIRCGGVDIARSTMLFVIEALS